MAKLVDALDLGSSGATHRSSSLLTRTTLFFFLCVEQFCHWRLRSRTRVKRVVKLVDALDLGSSGASKRSSSLLTRTTLRVCDATQCRNYKYQKSIFCKKDLIFYYIYPKIGRRIR